MICAPFFTTLAHKVQPSASRVVTRIRLFFVRKALECEQQRLTNAKHQLDAWPEHYREGCDQAITALTEAKELAEKLYHEEVARLNHLNETRPLEWQHEAAVAQYNIDRLEAKLKEL